MRIREYRCTWQFANCDGCGLLVSPVCLPAQPEGVAVMIVKTTLPGTIAIKHDAVGQNNLDTYPATRADGRTDRLGGAWLSVPAALALASTLVARSFVPLPAGREAVA